MIIGNIILVRIWQCKCVIFTCIFQHHGNPNKIIKLEDQIKQLQKAKEELELKYSITFRELDRVTADEELHRQQIMDLERSAVMNKHDFKEMQKKWNAEVESKQELEMKCGKELQKVNHLLNEEVKISQSLRESLTATEKELSDCNERLNKEVENHNKMKKNYTELMTKYNQSEQAYDEVQSKLKEVSNMKLALEQEKIRLQSDLSIATSQQRDDIYHQEELQERLKSLQVEMKKLQDKEKGSAQDIIKFQDEINKYQKSIATLQLELKDVKAKLSQEAQAHKETIKKRSILMSAEGRNQEAIRDTQVKLEQEKHQREAAEDRLLHVEKLRSDLMVDLAQEKKRNGLLEEELRTESEKARNLTLQVEQEIQRRTLLQNDFKTVSHQLTESRAICKQLKKELEDNKAASGSTQMTVKKLKDEVATTSLQMKEYQDQLETEQYFSALYKAQVKELKEEVEEKGKQVQEQEAKLKVMLQERDSVVDQLQLAFSRADSEKLARTIAEDQLSDVEKEKTMLELEIKDLMSRHKTDLAKKDATIDDMEQTKREMASLCEKLKAEKEDLENKYKRLKEDFKNTMSANKHTDTDIALLKTKLNEEKIKKEQAVNKLAEIMNRKEFRNTNKRGSVNSSELKKKEKECRKLQQELTMEREKYNKMVDKYQRDLSETQAALYEEGQGRNKLQMEMDAKDCEIEQLRSKLFYISNDSGSVNSGTLEEDAATGENHMEGWLAVPAGKKTKGITWKKQFIVVSSKKIFFYNSENDKMAADPIMVIDIEKLFHVRPVTQGDVYRAEAKDIPRIFQILYASEGENRKLESPQDQQTQGGMEYKGHDFLALHFRTPTTCETCNKPVWHMLHPPPALECRRCHVKVHKDHFDKNEEFIGYCKVNFEIQAKEMLLLAESPDKQQDWVKHLRKKVSKKGIVSSGSLGPSATRGTKQYSSMQRSSSSSSTASKSSTLPAGRP
ncbi:rho-associated protein kinase 2-like isoform X2 [Liolophura sinensis]|uniref:rho-associated protein kinase 2-like isoform X2 n=1 Tax=Liolophura sinensis TaxID=3198878 RepID=UPI0031592400